MRDRCPRQQGGPKVPVRGSLVRANDRYGVDHGLRAQRPGCSTTAMQLDSTNLKPLSYPLTFARL